MSGSLFFVSFALRLAHDFDVGPEVGEGAADFLLAGGEVLVEGFLARAEAFVEVEFGYLLGEAALDVFDRETAGAGVAGLDDVEEVRVGEALEDAEVFRVLPRFEPVEVEVGGRVAVDVG